MTEAIFITLSGLLVFFVIALNAIQPDCCNAFYKAEKKITPTYTILAVKDNEDCIEGVIYTLITQLKAKHQNDTSNILVIDFGSQDKTPYIVEKISQKYEFIHILHSSSYIDMVSS